MIIRGCWSRLCSSLGSHHDVEDPSSSPRILARLPRLSSDWEGLPAFLAKFVRFQVTAIDKISGQHLLYNHTLDISQPTFKAVVVERQTLMIQAEQMQDRGMKIVNVADVLNSLVTELVGRAI